MDEQGIAMVEYFLWLQPLEVDLVVSYKKGCRRLSWRSSSLLASTALPLNQMHLLTLYVPY